MYNFCDLIDDLLSHNFVPIFFLIFLPNWLFVAKLVTHLLLEWEAFGVSFVVGVIGVFDRFDVINKNLHFSD